MTAVRHACAATLSSRLSTVGVPSPSMSMVCYRLSSAEYIDRCLVHLCKVVLLYFLMTDFPTRMRFFFTFLFPAARSGSKPLLGKLRFIKCDFFPHSDVVAS